MLVVFKAALEEEDIIVNTKNITYVIPAPFGAGVQIHFLGNTLVQVRGDLKYVLKKLKETEF